MFHLVSGDQAISEEHQIITHMLLFIYLKSLFSAKDRCTKIEKMMHISKWSNRQGDSNSRLTEFVFGDEFIHKNTSSKYIVQKQITDEIKQSKMCRE